MEVITDNGNEIARTDSDTEGACIITWMRAPDISCDGWIEGGILFAPRDGSDRPGTWIDNGDPDKAAGWYDVATGVPAAWLNDRPTRVVEPL